MTATQPGARAFYAAVARLPGRGCAPWVLRIDMRDAADRAIIDDEVRRYGACVVYDELTAWIEAPVEPARLERDRKSEWWR